MTDVRETPQLGTSRYRLLSVLGEGAMATVYRARDEVLGVDRAIKVMAEKMVRNHEARERFLNEARVMATLAHPNVVRVVDAQLEGDTPYLVMELIPGGSLDLHVDHAERVHPAIAIRLVRDVLAGLAAAHDQGVVHRDVKPQNVLMTLGGKAKVTDFGVAHVADGKRGLTRTGTSLGTLAYLAPEQRQDASTADHRADIYAAGATLYHLVTGREPFDLYSTDRRDQTYKGISTKLAQVIAKACAYEPAERFDTAQAMAVALDQVSWSIPRKRGAREAMLAWAATIAAQQAEAESLPPPRAEGLTTPPAWGWDAEGGEPEPVVEPDPAEGTLGPVDPGLPPWVAVIAGGLLSLALAGAALLLLVLQPWNRAEPPPEPERVGLVEALENPTAPEVELPEPQAAEPVIEAPPKEPVEPIATARPTERAPAVPVHTEAPRITHTPPPEPEPEPVPEPEATATVTSYLNSRPWSRVALDGVEVGRTVYKADLPSGAHRLALTTGDGRTHEATITVTAGESLRYCWDFDLGGPCVR